MGERALGVPEVEVEREDTPSNPPEARGLETFRASFELSPMDSKRHLAASDDRSEYALLPLIAERRQVVPAVRPHDGVEREAGREPEAGRYDGFFSSPAGAVVVARAGS